MNEKQYQQFRSLVALFIGAIVSVAVVRNSYILAAAGVVTGMLFLFIVRSKTKITVDEREKSVREKAAQRTYAIFTPTIGIGSFLLIMFSRKEFYFLESLGMVLAYLTLFQIAVYAIAFHFLNRQYGGSGDEE